MTDYAGLLVKAQEIANSLGYGKDNSRFIELIYQDLLARDRMNTEYQRVLVQNGLY